MNEQISHLPTKHEFEEVKATTFRSHEDMLQFSKELGQWLVATLSLDELCTTAERVGSLYWHAVKINPPYRIDTVDPFGLAVLEAFAEHNDPVLQPHVDRLRRSKSSALNRPFSHRTILHRYGPNPPEDCR